MSKTLRAIHPNAGIRAAYRKELRNLIRDMQASTLWWLRAAYRKRESEIVGDASPAVWLQNVMNSLFAYWMRKWDSRARDIATKFVNNTRRRTRNSYLQAFRAAGFTVRMDSTRATNNVVAALIEENVRLIKTIPGQYFSEVFGLVQRSVSQGRDVGYLVDESKVRYGKTRNRADLIARDQSNKAFEAIKRSEGERLGVKIGIWVHIPGKYTIRESHKAMNGKPFLISEGMYDSQVKRKVLPGELVACQCTYRDWLPEFGDKVTPEIKELLNRAGG